MLCQSGPDELLLQAVVALWAYPLGQHTGESAGRYGCYVSELRDIFDAHYAMSRDEPGAQLPAKGSN